MSTTRFVDVIAGVLVAVGLSLTSTASQALPEYVAGVNWAWQTDKTTCATCHIDPAGGGPGNWYYEAFKAIPTHQTHPEYAALVGIPPGCACTTVPTTTTTIAGTSTTTLPMPPPISAPTTTIPGTTTSTIYWGGTTATMPVTTTTVASVPTTTTTQPASGAALYGSYCASCHDGAAADGGGRNVLGARTCSIDASLNGTTVFRGGVPAMQFLTGMLSAEQIWLISNYLNMGRVTGQQRYITACAGCHGADARGGRVGEDVRGSNPGEIRNAIREDEGGMGVIRCLPATDIVEISSYLRGKVATTRPSTTTTSSTTTHRRH